MIERPSVADSTPELSSTPLLPYFEDRGASDIDEVDEKVRFLHQQHLQVSQSYAEKRHELFLMVQPIEYTYCCCNHS